MEPNFKKSSFSLNIPIKNNKKLGKIIKFIENDVEINTLWRCSNVMAMERQNLNDHGPVHIKIVANRALKIFRMLTKNGVEPSIKINYGMTEEDAEVVILLGSVLHDLGLAIVRNRHEVFSIPLAQGILRRVLSTIYDEEETIIMISEILHAVLTHHEPSYPQTIEAGIVKVADALDMEKGRARISYQEGRLNIHSISASAIEKVDILDGEEKPITIAIKMINPAGVFQVDNLLAEKTRGSGLEKYIQIKVYIQDRKDPINLNLE
jgi:metal-dependent HD superfamily phosphatase/phosphodiesterase